MSVSSLHWRENRVREEIYKQDLKQIDTSAHETGLPKSNGATFAPREQKPEVRPAENKKKNRRLRWIILSLAILAAGGATWVTLNTLPAFAWASLPASSRIHTNKFLPIGEPTGSPAKGTQRTPQAQPGAFGNLVLVSWLEDAGKDVIYVQNTETNDVQKITSEPNLDNFRIVELHPNADPKLFEAVISNGSQQGPVRFRF